MNEKIKELARKNLVVEDEVIKPNGERLLTIREQDLVEFTKLIAMECVSIIDATSKKAHEEFKYMGDEPPSFDYTYAIKKQFGLYDEQTN